MSRIWTGNDVINFKTTNRSLLSKWNTNLQMSVTYMEMLVLLRRGAQASPKDPLTIPQ
jgi:hypothetical protein